MRHIPSADRQLLTERGRILNKVREGIKITDKERRRLQALFPVWQRYYEPHWISAMRSRYGDPR